MAGHVFLLACLLAICLPIVFVQLPRFATVKEQPAEKDAEERPKVLRRRPLQTSREVLRRITRPWSETSIDVTDTESEREQVKPTTVTKEGHGRR